MRIHADPDPQPWSLGIGRLAPVPVSLQVSKLLKTLKIVIFSYSQ